MATFHIVCPEYVVVAYGFLFYNCQVSLSLLVGELATWQLNIGLSVIFEFNCFFPIFHKSGSIKLKISIFFKPCKYILQLGFGWGFSSRFPFPP